MKRIFLLSAFIFFNRNAFAQENTKVPAKQFLLIVRYKSDMKTPDSRELQLNGQHWGAYLKELSQSGKLISGFRPSSEGMTITGTSKTVKSGVYDKSNEIVSSVLVIKAADTGEAESIAQKCPIYEFDGSVEIRPVMNTAN